ncbi:MAG: PIN domain-containing protein [Dehalococcoidia bacterium]|nr:PIN domain-containing protein [Dehalococcoidia bacterium]
MSRFSVDTNVIVAIAWDGHPDHVVATGDLERRLSAGATMVVPAHVLVESYSVLTRIPAPFRLSPADAVAFLEDLVSNAAVTNLQADAYLPLLREAAQARVTGGRIHDMLIAAASFAAEADVLLTFNTRDFVELGFDLDVREPSA